MAEVLSPDRRAVQYRMLPLTVRNAGAKAGTAAALPALPRLRWELTKAPAPGTSPGHLLTIPYGGELTVRWDVSDVPGAAGARLEVSAPGPGGFGSYATFNNPNGSVRDDNGHDSGSGYDVALPGASGQVTLTGPGIGLAPTLYSNVRSARSPPTAPPPVRPPATAR